MPPSDELLQLQGRWLKQQLDLFTSTAHAERRAKLMTGINRLNERFGRGTVGFATAQPRRGQSAGAWTTAAAWRSPAYTTNWDELWAIGA